MQADQLAGRSVRGGHFYFETTGDVTSVIVEVDLHIDPWFSPCCSARQRGDVDTRDAIAECATDHDRRVGTAGCFGMRINQARAPAAAPCGPIQQEAVLQ